MIEPRPEIREMPGYTPGRSIAAVMRERGIADVIKLASNESVWGPSPQVREAIVDAARDLFHYPEVIPPGLGSALAEHAGMDPSSILVGNGADEILRLAATAYVGPGDEVIYPVPSFAAYPYGARLTGGTPVPVPLDAEGAMDLPRMAAAIGKKTRLVYLCTPNNPTGGIFREEAWQAFLNAADDRVLIVVDQAYREFVDDPAYASVEAAIRDGRPVVMVRTFSKLYGLAGARIGWCAAPPGVIDLLRRVREPFSVGTLAIRAAGAALADQAYARAVRAETLRLRTWLADELSARGYSLFPSQANFLTIKIGGDDRELAARLESLGVIVRPTQSFGLDGCLRVTIAPQPLLERFLSALDAVVALVKPTPNR